MRVLVIEDSEKLQRAVALALRKAGATVDLSGNGEEGLWLAVENPYDAIVLDLMLPGLDGLSLLKQLRDRRNQTPVLVLTVKDSVDDRVTGLRSGADDYLTKPFALEELVARVESLTRRKYGERNPCLQFEGLEINTAQRTVTQNGRPIDLTPREYRLLEFLLLRRGEVVPRSAIEEHLYGESVEILSNAVESTISSLRKKLERGGALLQTRRGHGYMLGKAP